jgi:uncharacterized protein YndB with AHSA1/START domain
MAQIPDVRKTVVVQATPQQCFQVFVGHPMDWWPPSHVLLKQPRVALAFESGVGGRYYESDADGNQIDWGRIIAWNPPHGLTMTWRVDGRWQSIDNDDAASEIEVSFRPLTEGTTRVELAHVKLHKHGDDAPFIHRALDGPSPGETLELFAKAIIARVG